MPKTQHDSYAAFRVRDFRLFFVGMSVALIGTRVQTTAIYWDIFARTEQALSLGIVGLVQVIPVFALALPAGYLADRFNRKRVMMIGLLGTSLTSIGLAWLSMRQLDVTLIYAVLALDAAIHSLTWPARSAILPQLVPDDTFANAITWRSMSFQMSSVAGPALGGVVLLVSVSGAYVISAVSTLIFAIMLLFVRCEYAQQTTDRAANWRQFASSMFDGIRFVWHKRILLAVIGLDMFAVLFGGCIYLLPIFAKKILKVSEVEYGYLLAAPAIGAMVTALLIAHLPPIQRAGRTLLLAVVGFGLATIVFGLSQSFLLSWAMLCLTGACDNVSVVIRHTLVQLLTPDQMRGRVSAVNTIFISTSNELGGFESGTVAHFFGPVVSVVSGGIGTLVVVAAAAFGSRTLRRFGPLAGAEPEERVADKDVIS